jgi:hypothetical protein
MVRRYFSAFAGEIASIIPTIISPMVRYVG